MVDKTESLQAFANMKFGMFIHFGLYALGEKHEWHMHREKMKKEKYAKKFMPIFDPDPKGMEQWVVTAKEMGAKYLTVTSKHHDGFCLWDTKIKHPVMPNYNIRSTPFYQKNKTGVIEKLYEATEKHDMKLGLYYSTIDWSFTEKLFMKRNQKIPQDPQVLAQYNTYYQAQCHELKEKFPNIFDIWFDGYQFQSDYPKKLQQKKLYDDLTASFPKFLVASNPGVSTNFMGYKDVSDIILIENAGHSTEVKGIDKDTESSEDFYGEVCFNINRHWGFNAQDKEYKSPEYIADILKNMGTQKINVLLNYGPHWNGFILDEQVEIAKEIGKLIK
jgi:alpha-L-fucosidase